MATDPGKTYDGKPCKRCTQTLRWKSSHDCVACVRAANRIRMSLPENVERNRERMQLRRETDPIYRYREQLLNRRRAALKRMAKRNARRNANG